MRLCLEKLSSVTAVPRPACWDPRRPRLSYGRCNLGTAAAQNLWGAGWLMSPAFRLDSVWDTHGWNFAGSEMRAGRFPSFSPSRPPVTQCLPLLTCLLQGGTCPSLVAPHFIPHHLLLCLFWPHQSIPITCCLTVSHHSALLSSLWIYTARTWLPVGLGHTRHLHHSCGR